MSIVRFVVHISRKQYKIVVKHVMNKYLKVIFIVKSIHPFNMFDTSKQHIFLFVWEIFEMFEKQMQQVFNQIWDCVFALEKCFFQNYMMLQINLFEQNT